MADPETFTREQVNAIVAEALKPKPAAGGWEGSAAQKAWAGRRGERAERREIAAALAAGPDPELALDVLAVAARSEMTDANFRAVGLLLSILYRPSFLRPPMSLARQLAAQRLIELAPKTPDVLSAITPTPIVRGPDHAAIVSAARAVAAVQDHFGVLAENIQTGKVTPIDTKATAKFILASRDRALGIKESKP